MKNFRPIRRLIAQQAAQQIHAIDRFVQPRVRHA
eukprot:COSAG06_NODE_40167_length_404_cov_1.511475_2_plen_33_part_01